MNFNYSCIISKLTVTVLSVSTVSTEMETNDVEILLML